MPNRRKQRRNGKGKLIHWKRRWRIMSGRRGCKPWGGIPDMDDLQCRKALEDPHLRVRYIVSRRGRVYRNKRMEPLLGAKK